MRSKKLGIILVGVIGSLFFGTSVYAESYASVNVAALNVRQAPREESSIAGVYTETDTVKIIDHATTGWYAVENDNGHRAYVKTDYLDIFKVKGVINTDGVNSRTYPTTDSRINTQLSEGQDISVLYEVGDWYHISLGSEPVFGFVHKSYVDSDFLYLLPQKDISEVEEIEIIEIKAEVLKAEVVQAQAAPQASKGNEIVSYARQFLGNPYKYGGTSLTNGADCSGFVQQVMKKAGVSLQRSSSAQYANNGVKVSTDQLQPGDLLFYGYNGRVSHVGIFAGNNKIINASSSTTGIIESTAFRTRGKPLIGAKRVL